MADPLSLTLAAVTLASALKEIVELAQMIQESCEKVSRNRRELHSLASEIGTNVFQLKKFGNDHYDVLCDAEDMKASLLGLINDMRVIHNKCREMFPPVQPKKMEKFKVAFTAWVNRNRMEEDIKDLRNRVNKCHSQFMMFAIMRIESHLVVMRRQNKEEARKSRQETGAFGASNDNLIAFMSSNARTLSKLPPEITADFISDTYLSLQIDVINGMVNQLSSNSYFVEDPLQEYLLPYRPVVPQVYSYDKNSIRQETIFQSLDIQSYLRNNSNLSIQAGAWSMVNLCVDLETLKMYEEALTIGKWTVKIFRTLAKTNPKIYWPYLVHSLQMVSRFYENVDDIDGSFTAIEEAVKISRALQSSSTNTEIEYQLGRGLSALAFTWGRKDSKEESLKSAQEAVDIFKNAINKNRERTPYEGLSVKPLKSPWTSLFEGIPHTAIISYGRALNRLSFSFQALGRLEDAFKTAKEALDVMIFSTKRFIDDSLEIEIAFMLLRISYENFYEFISLEEALSFSERAVALFRVHCVKDVEEHGISLCRALCEQANILGKMGRQDEALALCQETAELANHIMADQLIRAEALSQLSWSLRRLKRHDEAATFRTEFVTVYSRNKTKSSKEAHGYFHLGVELRLAGRWPEAIKALQAALAQYRALAFKDPEAYTKNIGKTLNELTANFVHCKGFEQAFNEGHESLKLHESLLARNPSVLTEYILALELNSLAAEVADNEDKCVERARYLVMCARRIATLCPTEGNLLVSHMIQQLAMVFCRFNRICEAETIIQEALEWHEQNPPLDEKDLDIHMCCLITAAAIVFQQGYIKKAEEYAQKSIDIGRPHSSYTFISSNLVVSMCRRVQIFSATGLYAEAVEASKDCIEFARQTQVEGIDDFIGCLQVAATAFKYYGRIDEAIAYIQEALELSRSDEIIEFSKDRPSALLLEAESITYLCEILADAGREAEALIEGKAAVDSTWGLKSKLATLPWSDIEPTYIDALETYSLRLAASGDLFDSLDRLVQVRSYYENRIDSRLGDSLNLARVLYAEGILCCASGQREDGAAAVAKLYDLQRRLSIVLPELSQSVEVVLKRQRTSPSWIALIKKLNLKCDHEHHKLPS